MDYRLRLKLRSESTTVLKINMYPSVKKYRKKPVVIEAALYTGDNLEELIEWSDGNLDSDACVVTLEGIMQLKPGSYLALGTAGEYYPIFPEVMRQCYDQV